MGCIVGISGCRVKSAYYGPMVSTLDEVQGAG